MTQNKRIDFIVVGAQKAGTTTLDAYLRQHPNIQMGAQKEVHFLMTINNMLQVSLILIFIIHFLILMKQV